MSAASFIHVGAPKTATTFLQNVLFPELTSVNYLGRTLTPGPLDRWAMALCKADSATPSAKGLTRLYDAAVGSHVDDRPSLISFEDFSAVRTSRLIDGARGDRLADRRVIAERLRAQEPNARVILTVREPAAIIESFYKYVLERNELYVDPDVWFDINRRHSGAVDAFYFGSLVALYDDLFGRSNVLVLCYEELGEDRAAFFQKLGAFLGEPSLPALDSERNTRVNVGPEGPRIAALKTDARLPARLRRRTPGFVKRLIAPGAPAMAAWRARVRALAEAAAADFADDVALLMTLRPELDLARFWAGSPAFRGGASERPTAEARA